MDINGYIAIYMPEHHRASSNGLVYEYIIIAEQKLGRPLKKEEVVHHKDYKRNNNSPDNLLIFKTKADHTSFHKGKQYLLDDEGIAYVPNKNSYYCINCGKLITKGAIRCVECSRKAQQKVIRPDREELKLLIREQSFVSIGKLFSVSDNAIRKWCKTYNLPTKKTIIKSIDDDTWSKI